MKLSIEINLDNAAFWNPDSTEPELLDWFAVADHLRMLANRIDRESAIIPEHSKHLALTTRDVNGDLVGTVRIKEN